MRVQMKEIDIAQTQGELPLSVAGTRRAPSQAVEAILLSLADSHTYTTGTLDRFGGVMRDFASFCENAHGIREIRAVRAEHALAFVHSLRAGGGQTSLDWKHVRRSALRMLFRQGRGLGLVTGDPTLDLSLPTRSSVKTRPLTDDELDLCRLCAVDSLSQLRRPLVWSLSEATGRTSEIPNTRIRDVDLERGRVYLHGSSRIRPRWGPLTEWGAEQIARRFRQAGDGPDPQEPLVIWKFKTPKEPRAATSMAVLEVLRDAGIAAERDVRPRSVVAWAGAKALASGATIDQVALMLGCRSLDQAAEICAFNWTNSGSRRGD